MLRNFILPTNDVAQSYTFATLPSAAAVNPVQLYFVTNVGVDGSYWKSDGTMWDPVNGLLHMIHSSYPFIVPSSGSVTVTTGAILLTTALDKIYPNAYMYFPAGAFTGSAAGFYYVVMSSTTAGIMYSNKYTSGQPSTPVSPALVTTGAGAYTQTTNATLAGQSFTIPANVLSTDGQLYNEIICFCNGTGGAKSTALTFGGQSLGFLAATSATGLCAQNYLVNQGSASRQVYADTNTVVSQNNGTLSVDTTADVQLVFNYKLATATDWIANQYIHTTLAL